MCACICAPGANDQPRLVLSLLIFLLALSARPGQAGTSEWVHPGADGKLVYKTTPAGDRIMDFSYAGYMGGGVAIPNVPVVQTVRPSGGDDDSDEIQAAIAAVSAMPLHSGIRGAVLLAPGTYRCSKTITISTSGVVLRGSGSGAQPGEISTIKMMGRPHVALAVRDGSGRARAGASSSDNQKSDGADFKAFETALADSYVPSGTMQFKVKDASGFAVGDVININRPVTEAWIKFMQMDDLVRDGRPQTWIRAGNKLTAQRRIAAIAGNTITIDVPLADSYDAKYLNPPGTSVVKVRPPTRLSQVGIENLHLECPPQAINHSQPHFQALRVSGEDCWVRDVVADETMNSVGVGGQRITLERVTVNRKAQHQGASKPAEFAPNGTQVLLDRCSVNADNVWFSATGGGVAGPVVLLNCTFRGKSVAESHQRWSTGLLYDNCHAPDGGIEFRNRGSMGSGHGWSMGWGVIWNCDAKNFLVQSPPGAPNWLIGSTGNEEKAPRPFGSGPTLPEGIVDSAGSAVAPKSLYLAQLAERLGPQALKNIGY